MQLKWQQKYGLEIWPRTESGTDIGGLMTSRMAVLGISADRHENLLILDREADLAAVRELLEHAGAEGETCRLLAVPADAVSGTDRFEDFAFVSRKGIAYFDADQVAAFRFTEEGPEAELALMQLQEYLIADISDGGQPWRLIERQLEELAVKLAAAYRCRIEWFDPGNGSS